MTNGFGNKRITTLCAMVTPQESRESGFQMTAGRPPTTSRSGQDVEGWLVEKVALELGTDPLKIDVTENLTSLGLGSIQMVGLSADLEDWLDQKLPPTLAYDCKSIRAIARHLVTTAGARAVRRATPIAQKRTKRDTYPLSFSQQRLWLINRMLPNDITYNEALALRLVGRINIAALERAFNGIVRRHEVLHTVFDVVDEQPVQRIIPADYISLPVHDMSCLPPDQREREALKWAGEDARTPFDLTRGPLLRLRLLRLDTEEHVLVLVTHHIVCDASSFSVFGREMTTLYRMHIEGRSGALAELPIQYADFAGWQRTLAEHNELADDLSYWRGHLRDLQPLRMPTDRPPSSVTSSRGATWQFCLPRRLADDLDALGRREDASLFMVLLSAFKLLLHRYSGQCEIVVGSPISGRSRRELKDLVGFFLNTLVLRTDLSGDPSFRQLLARVRKECLAAYDHQELPFEHLVAELQPERNLNRSPLFQVGFTLYDALKRVLDLPGLSVRHERIDNKSAKFDLTLVMEQGPEGLSGWFEYRTDLFDADTIARMASHLQTLLESVIADPHQHLSTLPLLTGAEQSRVLYDWNQTQLDFPTTGRIHDRIEEQVKRRPDAASLTFNDQQLTYAQLNERANKLARHLQALGVRPEQVVGIHADRSLEFVVGLVGILKAGGAFLPLDPSFPVDRLSFMLHDSGAQLVVSHTALPSQLVTAGVREIQLRRDWHKIDRDDHIELVGDATAVNIAYVIYTSGSTGRPKGTLLHHRGLCSLATCQQSAFGLADADKVLQFSALSFDALVWEVVMALTSGAELVLAPRERLIPGAELSEFLRRARITAVTLPPSALSVLPSSSMPQLRTMITAGEPCSKKLVETWATGRRFFNAYGPTETTVCASMALCRGDAMPNHNPPIGRPIGNTQLYILDAQRQPVPVGVPGRLHVGGVGLARGYHRRPELTAEKFAPNPFSSEPGARLYDTGDLARYQPDGNVDFLGRIDHQVKIRGFRIELEEVEAALRALLAVKEAAVVVRQDDARQKFLLAYVVPDTETIPTSRQLRRELEQALPAYMTPSAFVILESMPRSPNGKVDRRALSSLGGRRLSSENQQVLPRTDTERSIAAIWRELLKVDTVSVNDDFFQLGGHSLLTTRLATKLKSVFHVEIPLNQLFKESTVAGIAQIIDSTTKAQSNDAAAIEEALTQVQNLSDEQVTALLAQKANSAHRKLIHS